MTPLPRLVLAALLLAALLTVSIPGAPAAMQVQGAAQGVAPSDQQIYEKFRSWLDKQPGPVTDIEAQYGKVLTAEGLTAAEVDRRLRVIGEQLQKSEKERWNRILTSPVPRFNTKPNAFLVDVTRGLTPGKALDVGMGQGRNALYLAQQGW